MPGWHISSGGGGGGGTGDVVGPAGAVANDLVAFDGATGKLLKDSGILTANVVQGPATATDNGIARYDAATGKLLKDSSVTLSGEVAAFYTLSVPSAKGFSIASDSGLRLTNFIGTATGLLQYSGSSWRVLNGAGNAWELFTSSSLALPNTGQLKFGNSSNPEGPWDFGFERIAVGVGAPTNGGAGVGWINNQAGYCALSSDFTNATATPADLTGLTVTLLAGRKYTFRMSLFVSESVAGEGVAIDFDGGAATATDFRAHARIYDAALLLSAQVAALATDISVATVTGAGLIEVTGSFTVNAAGTFIPRAWQNSHATGTLTVETGSHLWVEDTSFI